MNTKHLVAVAVSFVSLLTVNAALAVSLTDSTAGAKILAGADVWSTPSNAGNAGDSVGFGGNAGGISYGLAGYYELRIIKLIGLEADIAYQHGSFHRNVTFNDIYKFTETVTLNSWRLPLLAKLNLPLPLGRAWFGLGPEFTIAQSSSAKVEQTSGPAPGAALPVARTHDVKPTYGTLGIGLVFEMPGTGIEVPIEFRASKNLSQPDSYAERVSLNATGYDVRAESSWVYRLGVGLGFSF
jgi:hypothetical protein